MLGDVWVLGGGLGSRSQVGIQAGIWVPGGIWVTDGGLGQVWIVEFHGPGWGLVLTGRFGSWAVVWVLGWGLELGWGLGLGWGSRSWVGVWELGCGSKVRLQVGFWMLGMGLGPGWGSRSWGRVWVPGGVPGLGSGSYMVSGFCMGVPVQGCGLGPGLGSGSQLGVWVGV